MKIGSDMLGGERFTYAENMRYVARDEFEKKIDGARERLNKAPLSEAATQLFRENITLLILQTGGAFAELNESHMGAAVLLSQYDTLKPIIQEKTEKFKKLLQEIKVLENMQHRVAENTTLSWVDLQDVVPDANTNINWSVPVKGEEMVLGNTASIKQYNL